jgi:heptosyltransferase-1
VRILGAVLNNALGARQRQVERAAESPAQPRRVLLVRLSAIGDIVFASPLIASARRAYPNAYLAWLVQPECAPLLVHHPDLDEVIEWPLPHWRRLWKERRFWNLIGQVADAMKMLRARRFELAIDLQGLLKSALPMRLCGARERIGLGSREGAQLLMTGVVGRGPDSQRISSEYRYLAARLRWPLEAFRMRVYPGTSAEDEAESLIAEHGLSNGYAVICPFTTRPQKHWVFVRWAHLATAIHQTFGLPTLMLGSPADREAAQQIIVGCDAGAKRRTRAGLRLEAEADPHPGADRGPSTAADDASAQRNESEVLVDLVGATSLLCAAALIGRARLLVGVDTGLSHMGIAFARPTVLLFGSTCPYTETGAANARVLYHRRDCSPCRRRPTCNGDFNCMRDIEVDEVMATLTDLDQLAGLGRPIDRGDWAASSAKPE